MRLFALLALAASPCLFASPALAQDLPALGFAATGTPRAVGLFDTYDSLASGERIEFDGTTVERVAEDGTWLATLATFNPAFSFPSFVLLDASEATALVGESDFGGLYRVDLVGGGATFVADVDLNYDAVFEDADHVLVSASPCFNCGSTIERVQLSTGQVTNVATLSGASGPLALSATGDLYYGLQPVNIFAPPGSWSVIRYTAAQLQLGLPLLEADAALFAGGLDSSASMVFDPVYGHLIVAESPFSGPTRIVAFDRNGQRYSDVVTSTLSLSKLELRTGLGYGSFQAYQPAGVELAYRSTDWGAGTSVVRRVQPVRPIGSLSGPGVSGPGPVTFTVTGAAPNSTFLFIIGRQTAYTPIEYTIDTGTYLFHSGLTVFRRPGVNPPTDASGTGSHTFENNGTLQGTRVMQAVIRNAQGVLVGTSTTPLL